jgi:hypothetical protein
VERCFRDISTERLRRGLFTRVPELEAVTGARRPSASRKVVRDGAVEANAR